MMKESIIKTASTCLAICLFSTMAMASGSNNTKETTSTSIETTIETTAANNIESIESLSKEVTLDLSSSLEDHHWSWFLAHVKDQSIFTYEDLIFVSDNPEIATIEYDSTALTTYIYYTIKGVSAGETYCYVTSKDGTIVSEKIKVIVTGEPQNTIETNEDGETILTMGMYASIVKSTLDKTFSSNTNCSYDVLYDNDTNTIMVNFNQKGSATVIAAIKNGETQYQDTWDNLCESMKNLSQTLYDNAIELGYENPIIMITIVNDSNPDMVLLAYTNGEETYNVLNDD